MRLSDIEQFHSEYLRVPDAPPQRPYIQPFKSRGKGVSLLNKNLQGSYAQSSIRPGKPLSQVIRLVPNDQKGSGSSNLGYELVADHANKVLSEMLAGNRLLAVSLAFFLFRDRTLALPQKKVESIIPALREFFFVRPHDPEGDQIYETLFENDSASYSDSDLAKY